MYQTYMADQMISAEWGASDTVRKGVLTIGWTTGTATGGGVPSRDHILVGGQYKLYI
jgi:hypothetical protein